VASISSPLCQPHITTDRLPYTKSRGHSVPNAKIVQDYTSDVMFEPEVSYLEDEWGDEDTVPFSRRFLQLQPQQQANVIYPPDAGFQQVC
jgi:hypothetical protein